MPRKILYLPVLLIVIFAFSSFSVSSAQAKPGEYKAIVNHLKTRYGAKKVDIPLLWLARFAVRVARPAGVKSFSLTMFENLRIAPAQTVDAEMQTAMRDSMGAGWTSIFRVRSRKDGSQVYMYMRESGADSVKIMLVTIDRKQAAVIRAVINPDKLAEFVNNPKIFGISLGDNPSNSPPQTNGGNAKPKT